jgi:hypothetical protein
MALKKTKITKYTTSDGKVFLGGDSKQKAQHHEEDLQKFLTDYRYMKRVADIVGMEDKLEGITEKGLMDEYNDPNSTSFQLDEISDQMTDELLKNSYCATDCQDLEDLVDMVCGVIDDFGGIVAITLLYRMYKENNK